MMTTTVATMHAANAKAAAMIGHTRRRITVCLDAGATGRGGGTVRRYGTRSGSPHFRHFTGRPANRSGACILAAQAGQVTEIGTGGFPNDGGGSCSIVDSVVGFKCQGAQAGHGRRGPFRLAGTFAGGSG